MFQPLLESIVLCSAKQDSVTKVWVYYVILEAQGTQKPFWFLLLLQKNSSRSFVMSAYPIQKPT